MNELDDQGLLADFAHTGSEAAFATLVGRYVNLVYSAALRYAGNPHHAQEITQAVFLILARKAGGLRRGTVLSGWLYQTARLTAANFMKGEMRRQHREQEAYMQSTLNQPDAAAWQEISPLLDEAMGELGETDRSALVLRYFENKTAAESAAALKLTEAATHKRVNRALEKLRKFFSRRGVVLSAAVIAGAVSANSVQAAPAGLMATVTTAAAKGTMISATLTTLVKGTMKTMTWLKFKFAVGVGVAALLAGGVATVAISQTGPHTVGDGSLTAKEILGKSESAYAALSSYSDNGKTESKVGDAPVAPHIFTIKLARPALYRVEWDQNSGFFDQKGAAWSAGDGDFMKMGNSTQKCSSKENALGGATGISGGAAASIPGTFFKMNWGNQLGAAAQSATRKADEKIGDVDCYVLTSANGGRTRTLWIGKQDFLIRQIENDTSAASMKALMDEQLKQHPEMAANIQRVPAGATISIETHTNIVVDQGLSPADFAPQEAAK